MKVFSRFRSLAIVLSWLLARAQVSGAETNLIPFELGSHDERSYTERSWAGRPLLLVVSTRESASHNEGLAWSAPIAAALTEVVPDLALVRVATVPRGVPRLFGGVVRNAVKPLDEDTIRVSLLDWENLFARHYGLSGDDYNVLVFDRQGALVYSVALQSFDQQRLDTIIGELRALADTLKP